MNITHILLQYTSLMSDGSYTEIYLLLLQSIFDPDDPHDNKPENISFSQASLDAFGAVIPRRGVRESNL